MEGLTEKLIDVLLAIVIFCALITVIITSVNGVTWSALNIAGTEYNMAWAPYVIVLVLVVGLVVLVYRYILKGKK